MNDPAAVFQVGAMNCHIVTDGVNHYPREMLLGDLPPDLEVYIRPLLDDKGLVRLPYNCLLVQTADATVLIDTGGGAELGAAWGTPVGRLQESLAAAGVTPEDITHVLLTHAHPDHVGGLTLPEAGGRVVAFPRARHYVSRVEHDFWMDGDRTAEYAAYPELAPMVRMHLGPLIERGMLELVDGDAEPVPGFQFVPTPGHTPGHVAVVLTSGSERATFAGDVLLMAGQAERPEWTIPLDVAPEVTVGTRRRLLDGAAFDGSLLVLCHIDGAHRVERLGGGYRLVAASGELVS